MSIQNDVGQPVYDGPAEYRPGLPALRHLVLFDMSEGVVGWYIGYDGTGCVTLARVGDSVTVDDRAQADASRVDRRIPGSLVST